MRLADANVVIDFLDPSPERLRRARAVAAMVSESGEPLVVTEVVLAEVFWVLSGGYAIRGEVAVEVVEALLASSEFTAWDEPLVSRALDIKRHVPELDVADCVLAARALVRGDEVVTNDRLLRQVIEKQNRSWEKS